MDILPKCINNNCYFPYPKYIWPTLFQVWTDPLIFVKSYYINFFYFRYGGKEGASFCALTTLCKQLDSDNAIDVYQISKLYHNVRPNVWKSEVFIFYRTVWSFSHFFRTCDYYLEESINCLWGMVMEARIFSLLVKKVTKKFFLSSFSTFLSPLNFLVFFSRNKKTFLSFCHN